MKPGPATSTDEISGELQGVGDPAAISRGDERSVRASDIATAVA